MKPMTKRISVAVAAAFLLLVAGCGKDDKGNNNPAAKPAITNINEIVSATNRLDLVGREVNITDAVVQGNPIGFYIFLSGLPHSVIPVARLDKKEGRAREPVRAGQRVRINGTIRLIETTSATEWMWQNINENERRDIEAQRIYILAKDVMVVH